MYSTQREITHPVNHRSAKRNICYSGMGFIVFNKKQEFIFFLGLEMIYPFRSRKVKW